MAYHWVYLMNFQQKTFSGWWFGTFFIFPYIRNCIIPTDFHIFQRGRYTTNQIGFNLWIWAWGAYSYLWRVAEIKHENLENPRTKYMFIVWKIMEQNQMNMFHCHVWLPEGSPPGMDRNRKCQSWRNSIFIWEYLRTFGDQNGKFLYRLGVGFAGIDGKIKHGNGVDKRPCSGVRSTFHQNCSISISWGFFNIFIISWCFQWA